MKKISSVVTLSSHEIQYVSGSGKPHGHIDIGVNRGGVYGKVVFVFDAMSAIYDGGASSKNTATTGAVVAVSTAVIAGAYYLKKWWQGSSRNRK